MTFTIYSNNTITVTGAINTLRIKAVTSGGYEQNLTSHAQTRVRVYNYNRVYGDNQPFVDYNMPAYIKSGGSDIANPELAELIARNFPA